jgi:uncharacterized membrane protein YhhN
MKRYVALALGVVNLAIMLVNFNLSPADFYGRVPLVFLITKPLIMPLTYVHWSLNLGQVPRTLVTFCIACWLGDLFLLYDSFPTNAAGCISFLVAHLAVIRWYAPDWKKFRLWVVAMSLPSTLLLLSVVPALLKHWDLCGAIGYFVFLDLSLIAFLQKHIAVKGLRSPKTWVGFAGHVMFTVSDSILLTAMAGGTLNSSNFQILLTYTVAILGISAAVTMN